jgi:pantoate--beta-alanine ligase|tara:strand:- start:71 stop:916 length:846 start_codon:yes stop_codon:yes gene_type:complete
MKIIKSIEEMREYCQQLKRKRKTIGSVGTEEGYLHDGHMSLVKIAKENADVVVLDLLHTVNYFECSPEEYERLLEIYEQDFLEKDIELCKLNNVDVLFLPSMHDMYLNILPLNISIPVIELWVSKWKPRAEFIRMCRETYNIMLPDVTVVGQKDVYQNFAIKSLIKQLGLPIKVIIAPTLRDFNGVALSSRNKVLRPDDYKNVISIYKTLQEVASWKEIEPINYIKSYITHHVKSEECCVDICCAETLKDLDVVLDRKALITITAFFGEIFIDDNIIVDPK